MTLGSCPRNRATEPEVFPGISKYCCAPPPPPPPPPMVEQLRTVRLDQASPNSGRRVGSSAHLLPPRHEQHFPFRQGCCKRPRPQPTGGLTASRICMERRLQALLGWQTPKWLVTKTQGIPASVFRRVPGGRGSAEEKMRGGSWSRQPPSHVPLEWQEGIFAVPLSGNWV